MVSKGTKEREKKFTGAFPWHPALLCEVGCKKARLGDSPRCKPREKLWRSAAAEIRMPV